MLALSDRLHPHPDVVTTELAGDDGNEGVLLHLATQQYFSLNLTGLEIWRRLGDGLPLVGVAAKLTERFDVSSAEAEQAVLRLAQDLLQARLAALVSD